MTGFAKRRSPGLYPAGIGGVPALYGGPISCMRGWPTTCGELESRGRVDGGADAGDGGRSRSDIEPRRVCICFEVLKSIMIWFKWASAAKLAFWAMMARSAAWLYATAVCGTAYGELDGTCGDTLDGRTRWPGGNV